MRVAEDNIQDLKENEIFVFGSNLSGIHGAGAALLAYQKFEANLGVGHGITGKCYAIPTKSEYICRTLSIEEIRPYINNFIQYAKSNANKQFLVTEIGCGIAGYTPEEIAPLFKDAINIKNIHFPKRFWKILNNL